jgi:16S rRNA processing protein RimM
MSKQFNDTNNLLHIATVGKTVGIKGDMKFHIKCDFPEQFKKNASFFINKKDKITLDEVNFERDTLRILGVNSVEDAKKYTNVKLFTTYEDTKLNCHLDEGQYFWFDILGCKVFENDILLGIVQEVERIAMRDYLNVKTDESLVKSGLSKLFLIPYHKPFIVNTDIEKKIIAVSGGMDILEAS